MAAPWKAPAVARLLRLARAGESWQAIGAQFYPGSGNPRRAATAAAEAFRRHAGVDDVMARRDALKQHNFNKPRGFGRHAITRRRRRRVEIAVPRQRLDPWVGLGPCFL